MERACSEDIEDTTETALNDERLEPTSESDSLPSPGYVPISRLCSMPSVQQGAEQDDYEAPDENNAAEEDEVQNFYLGTNNHNNIKFTKNCRHLQTCCFLV